MVACTGGERRGFVVFSPLRVQALNDGSAAPGGSRPKTEAGLQAPGQATPASGRGAEASGPLPVRPRGAAPGLGGAPRPRVVLPLALCRRGGTGNPGRLRRPRLLLLRSWAHDGGSRRGGGEQRRE